MLFNEELETLETDLLMPTSELDGDQAAPDEDLAGEDELVEEEDADLDEEDAALDADESEDEEPAA